MNTSKDDLEEVASLLESLGKTDKREYRIKILAILDAGSLTHLLPEFLDESRLEQVIRGLCRIEGGGGREISSEPRMSAGSATVVPRLVERLRLKDSERADALTDWLFSNRANTYIPFGYDIPLGINSREEYAEYEERREKHRQEKLAADQEEHRKAVTRKQEKAQLHSERSKRNRQDG